MVTVNCFLKLIASFENCTFAITEYHYKFTLEDLRRKIMELDISVESIESCAVNVFDDDPDELFLEFVKVIRDIKHLKELSFSCEHFLFAPPPLESLLSLPIRTLTTDNLKFEEG